MKNFSEKVSFIWSVADLLRGDYKQSEYGRVILPFLVLRRLDQVLAPTRKAVLEADAKYPADKTPEALRERMLLKASGETFYNTSKLDFTAMLDDPNNSAANLSGYVHGFSKNVRDIMEKFRFEAQVARLDGANILFLVLKKFVAVDLDPYQRRPDGSAVLGADGKPASNVSNLEMGYIFEELIRKFSEQSNETAGEHFTPREVIKFMVTLLFAEDDDALNKPGIVRTIYDPACGTGGMLSVAEEYLSKLNPQARLKVFGQELNGESYAICKADMLIKGQEADNIKYGNSFNEDGLPELKADYLISNPPFGVDWSKAQKAVNDEHKERGFAGRFGPGLPRKNDGSLLFLLHMLSKMRPVDQGGSRLAIVFNGSPLFAGAAGSGESKIRQWIIENDWLEAIVALPDQMFYNTGISTYIWLVTNRKAPHRRGKVQLINGVSYFQKMRKSLGDKRKELSDAHIQDLAKLYAEFDPTPVHPDVQVFDNADFGFHRITVERPLQLNFQASVERIARLKNERTWQGLVKTKKKGEAGQKEIDAGQALQEAVLGVLNALDGTRLYKARPEFVKALKAEAKTQGVTLPANIQKAILSALSERDETAKVCRKKGSPESDTGLRDCENVPLTEDIGEYMAREVLPHVPDAWVDESKTKLGYEIPFPRYFYSRPVPTPPSSWHSVIERQLDKLQDLLSKVQDSTRETPSIQTRATAIPWCTTLPAHWDETRAKYLFRRMRRRVAATDSEIVTAFRDGEVTARSNRRSDGFTFAEKEIGYQAVRRGDLVIHSMDGFAGAIGVSDSDGRCSPVYLCCTPWGSSDPHFYGYLLRHLATSGFISSLAKGIRERSTSFGFTEFSELLLPEPPFAEQVRIGRFLRAFTQGISNIVGGARNSEKTGVLNELGTTVWAFREDVVAAAVTGRLRVPEEAV